MAAGDYRVYPAAATGAAPVSTTTAFSYGTAVSLIPIQTLPRIAITSLLIVPETAAATTNTTYDGVLRILVSGVAKAEVPFVVRDDTSSADYYMPVVVSLSEPMLVPGGAPV